MLETFCKVGLQPEGANYDHSETVINLIRQLFWKRKDNNNKVLAIIQHVVAKFFLSFIFPKFYWLLKTNLEIRLVVLFYCPILID